MAGGRRSPVGSRSHCSTLPASDRIGGCSTWRPGQATSPTRGSARARIGGHRPRRSMLELARQRLPGVELLRARTPRASLRRRLLRRDRRRLRNQPPSQSAARARRSDTGPWCRGQVANSPSGIAQADAGGRGGEKEAIEILGVDRDDALPAGGPDPYRLPPARASSGRCSGSRSGQVAVRTVELTPASLDGGASWRPSRLEREDSDAAAGARRGDSTPAPGQRSSARSSPTH